MREVAVAIISRIVANGQKEFLLIQSKKDFGEHTGCYYPPSGHIEEGEDVRDALIRELYEELHLSIEPIKEIARSKGDLREPTHWWGCKIISGEIKMNESELSDARYFSVAEINELRLWPATEKFFREFIFE